MGNIPISILVEKKHIDFFKKTRINRSAYIRDLISNSKQYIDFEQGGL